MNYADIGFIIGHELSHGLGKNSRNFDKNGNLFKWWDSDSDKEYSFRAQCFIDQYNKFKIKEVNLTVS